MAHYWAMNHRLKTPDLNDACENVASDYCPQTDSREVSATPCPKNKEIDNYNSFATAPIRKEVEIPKLRVHNMAYKSPGNILPLQKSQKEDKQKK